MEGSFKNGEKRSHPRFVIDLSLEYREMGDSWLRGGIVIDVSEGGEIEEISPSIRSQDYSEFGTDFVRYARFQRNL